MGGWGWPNTYVCLQSGWVGLGRCLRNQKNKKINIFLQQSFYYCNIKWIHKHLVISQVHKIRNFLKNSLEQMLKLLIYQPIPLLKKICLGWVGFQKSYVIITVGYGKCLRWLTRWVGGVKKD